MNVIRALRPMSNETVTMRGVSRRYGAQVAVDAVDLTLRAGECVGLVGHNGAGKSTLIKIMLGLVRPDGGSVQVLGEDPSARHAVASRRALGYLPENVALHPSLTGAETLAFYARLKGRPVKQNGALLKRVGIDDVAHRRVGTYSKGMRQRLGLAQALLGNPRALLLDEPTSGLDPALRHSFYEIIRDLRRDGATILLSSHALAELEEHIDRVVVLNRGRKVADGSIVELRNLAAILPRVQFRADGAGPDCFPGWSSTPDRRLQRSCAEQDLCALLRSLPPTAHDIEILRPTLDQLYVEFQKGAA
ncbi:MAG TPA: ABC transporter ATP-binding protein [Rhizomicrobium sp.]